MDIGEKRIGVFSPRLDALFQVLNQVLVAPALVDDVSAKWPIQQGDRDPGMRACFFQAALGIGGNALEGVRETGLSQNGRELLPDGNVAAPAVVPGSEQFV